MAAINTVETFLMLLQGGPVLWPILVCSRIAVQAVSFMARLDETK